MGFNSAFKGLIHPRTQTERAVLLKLIKYYIGVLFFDV